MHSCDARTRAYKNGKTFEECKEMAKITATRIAKQVDEKGDVLWSEILETVNHDELVYKLTLKYLRLDGYDIGNWKMPKVTKITV